MKYAQKVKTVGNTDCIDADVLEKFDYSALGHIHKPMKVGSETIRYCGTPMAYSVSEAGQEKGILMVDIGEQWLMSGLCVQDRAITSIIRHIQNLYP